MSLTSTPRITDVERRDLTDLPVARPAGVGALAAASGVMLVGASGEILEMDAGAAAALALGGPLQVSAGRVQAREAAAEAVLKSAIAAAAASTAVPETVLNLVDVTRERRSRWRITPRRGAAGAMLMLLPDAGEPPRDACATLMASLGFTPAEATCALLLVQGLGIDQVAARQGVSRNTVRAHLRSLYAKSGTHRQIALVALVNRTLAGVVVSRFER